MATGIRKFASVVLALIMLTLISTACAATAGSISKPAVNMTLRNAFIGWDFGGTEGWRPADGKSSVAASAGVLSTKIAAGGAALYSPGNLRIPCSVIRTVEFGMRSAAATRIKLLWKTTNSGWSQDKSASIAVINDGKYHDYQIELSQHPKWTGTVVQLKVCFTGAPSGDISLDYLKLTGLYFVPFAMLSGDMAKDLQMLVDIKRSFFSARRTAVIGYSIHLEYLSGTNAGGSYQCDAGNLTNPAYHVKLAKLTGMPVMFWLRGDPWGYQNGGVYKQLMRDDNALMWTAAVDSTRFYRNPNSGYGYLCLAAADLSGRKTVYWQRTERLLGQCAEKLGGLIRRNPGCILGVTTTSEYKFNAEDNNVDLDYNPNTIREFRDHCKKKYSANLSAFNSRMNTSFSTWELQSNDYNSTIIERSGGFDAPRVRDASNAFWKEWTVFRGLQIRAAVQHQVDIISRHIDSKYIYTHQIPSPNAPVCSPAESGNVAGANVGIDMFNSEVTEANIETIAGFVAGNYARSWGVPEWLPTTRSGYDESLNVLHLMHKHGVKYLAPLAWGCGEPYEVKGSPSESACREFLSELDSHVLSK